MIDAGILTARQLESRAWCRVFQGVYADSSIRMTPLVRCAVAVAFILPPDGVIAGRSAALIYGAGFDEFADRVESLVPRVAAVFPRAGLVVHRGVLRDGDRQRFRGLPVTTPIRTCWDVARWLPVVEAVVLVDRMLRARLVTRADLVDYLALTQAESPGPRGLRRYERVVALADGAAESPQESRLRVRLVLAGFPAPRVQFNVFDRAGAFVARLDLAWDEFKLAVEYDGLWHVGSAKQMDDDKRRLNALSSLGWTVLHVTSARLRDDFDGLVREIRAAMRHRPR